MSVTFDAPNNQSRRDVPISSYFLELMDLGPSFSSPSLPIEDRRHYKGFLGHWALYAILENPKSLKL